MTGLALPYGLPKLFMQTTKNLDVSKALPGPPSRGPHQSPTSALPVSAWQMTMALSRPGDRVPYVLYATKTFWRTTPDSSSNSGTIAKVWSGIRPENGFSGWDVTLPEQLLDSAFGIVGLRHKVVAGAGGRPYCT